MGDLGLRSEKELRTLGMAIDMIVEGYIPEALDILVGRFQGVETAEILGWPAASHLERIPPTLVSSVSENARGRAVRQEARERRDVALVAPDRKHRR